MKTLSLLSLLSAATLFACSSPSGGSSEPWTQNGPGNGATPGVSGGDSGGAPPTGGGGSDGGGVVPPSATHISSDETWSTGKQIATPVVIDAGVTVTIAPGAVITCASGVSISVAGTLTASSEATHAKITGTWTGILVVVGGTLSLDVVDLAGGVTAIESEGTATYDHGTLTGAVTPFLVDIGGKISTTHATVSNISGNSTIKGAFVASYLDYDKGSNEGILAQDPSATISIDDSTLHGSGSGDFVVSQSGTSVHVGYTTISGAHCGFHFDSVGKFDITYTTDDTNSYGTMLYGSDNNGSSITYSNFANSDKDIDLEGTNGPLTMDHVYTGGKNSYVGGAPTITNVAPMPIGTAHPR